MNVVLAEQCVVCARAVRRVEIVGRVEAVS